MTVVVVFSVWFNWFRPEKHEIKVEVPKWNFETDYKQSNILSLYGIWVSKGE